MPHPLNPIPPQAARKPKRLTLHGDTRIDDYDWLRQRNNPAVMAYIEAENCYTEQMTAAQQALRETLYDEMLARIEQDDCSVPYRLGDYFYYSRVMQGQQYPNFYRKQAQSMAQLDAAAESLLLDVNALAADKAFTEIGEFEISPDGNWLAYTVDQTGFRQYRLYIKQLIHHRVLKFRRERVTSLAWAQDNQTLFYTVEDKQTKRSFQLWRHGLGDKKDVLIYEEKDQRFNIDVYASRSQAYLFLQIGSHTSSEIRYLSAHHPNSKWQLLIRRRPNIEYDVEHHGAYFYLRCNDRGPNYRLLRVPVDGLNEAEELIPHRADIELESVEYFQHFRVLRERHAGLSSLLVSALSDEHVISISFPDPVYRIGHEANAAWDACTYRYTYESLTTPETVFDYDLAQQQSHQIKQAKVLGDFDRANYNSERRWVKARDGTLIPVSLVYRRDANHQGAAPLWLEGYGAYGIPNDVYFASERLSLLDRGMIYAVAHIRGGGDLGQAWHDAGKMLRKQNSFTDFIAVAEYLIGEGLTSAEQLVIEGGSAGGLLMGAVVNQRPDLFGLVIADVPFLDVLTTMQDESLPLTVGEYEEWGNPKYKSHYQYIKRYSPYDNLRKQDYPSMLVKTSLHDSQVMYWEPVKYVAKLRSLKTDDRPLLLQVNLGAGHGGASGRYDSLRELAFDYAWVLSQLNPNQASR